MAKKMEPEELLAALAHFTGTTQWYRNPMFPAYTYTDGVKFLAEQAGAYWLIDYVFSNQLLPEIRGQVFQVWKIYTANDQAIVKVDDGNGNILKEFKIPYTDFPLEEFTLYFTDNVLLLVREY
jgi:hypothetical protein